MLRTIKRLINKRVIIHCEGNRSYEGDLIACDNELNVVLDDAEEYFNENIRYIGLMVIKGRIIFRVDIVSPSLNVN